MHIAQTQQGLTVTTDSEAETERLGRALADEVTPGVVIGLVGDLGSGKTRLSRAIAEALGVDPAAITSPTFVLIHEYEGRIPVFHFDAYRLNSADAFEALGVADYWDGGGICLVEWADLVADRLPTDAWWVRIEPIGVEGRRFQISWPPAENRADRLADRLARFDA